MEKKSPENSSTTAPAAPVQKKQDKTLGYVNWSIKNAAGEVALRSNRGFVVKDNKFASIEERALIELAEKHGVDGKVTVQAELTIIVAKEKPAYDVASMDIPIVQNG